MSCISIDYQRNEYLDDDDPDISQIKKEGPLPDQVLKPIELILTQDKLINGEKYKKNKKLSKIKHCCKQKHNGYPTKNFFPLFRYPHKKIICKKVQNYKQNKVVDQIFSKQGISRRDYQILYSQPQLSVYWSQMFNKKILYRQLLLSRANLSQKIIFNRKIFRFQQAFITKSFDRIN